MLRLLYDAVRTDKGKESRKVLDKLGNKLPKMKVI